MPRSSMTLGRGALGGASAIAASFHVLEREQQSAQGQKHLVLQESDQNDRQQDRIDLIRPTLAGRYVRERTDATIRGVDDLRENDVRPRKGDQDPDVVEHS